jgi:chromosome segregation ATPase
MAKGDMKMAAKAVKELAEKLKSGKMSEAEKKKLANDIKQLAKEFQKIQAQHKAKKEQLKKDIAKAMKQGDPNKAAKLQAKLDEMEKQERQMNKMKKMAQKMAECANCMKKGGGKKKDGKDANGKDGKQGQAQQKAMEDAAEGLEDLAKEMEQMEEELKEMEALEDLEKAIGEAKGEMNGKGDDSEPQWTKNAKGGGRGAGEREREEDKTGKYKSRVKGKLQRGQTVVTGDADGSNITGRSTSEVRKIVRKSMSQKSDPLENQILPKSQREHAKEYFEKLRGN